MLMSWRLHLIRSDLPSKGPWGLEQDLGLASRQARRRTPRRLQGLDRQAQSTVLERAGGAIASEAWGRAATHTAKSQR